jgi:hypothetical protein
MVMRGGIESVILQNGLMLSQMVIERWAGASLRPDSASRAIFVRAQKRAPQTGAVRQRDSCVTPAARTNVTRMNSTHVLSREGDGEAEHVWPAATEQKVAHVETSRKASLRMAARTMARTRFSAGEMGWTEWRMEWGREKMLWESDARNDRHPPSVRLLTRVIR